MNYEDFPVDYLWECFDVNFQTGKLTWKQRPRYHFETDFAYNTINPRQFGKVAGSISKNDYWTVGLRGIGESKKVMYQHRILYAMFHGVWPDETIDHFDGNTKNNSISNLRPASQSVNTKNQRLRNTNKSGLHGVRWYNRYNAWHATGTYNYKVFHLGYHENLLDAICARRSWELNKEFTERHGT
jgi:hypothetical protein